MPDPLTKERYRMTSIPKVWVVQEGHNDYSPAEQFGEVNFITKSDLRNMEGSEQNRELLGDVRSFLSNYIAGVDYIIPVGNPMVNALISMCLSSTDHKFLKWDGRRATYILFNLNPKMVKP